MEHRGLLNGLSTPIPERLREARLARGYSMQELAEILGVSKQAISQYELGQARPGGDILKRMVDALGFSLSFFRKPIQTENFFSNAIFFRCLRSADKKVRDKVSVRIDWVGEIFDYLKGYLNFPVVNLPNLHDLIPEGQLDEEDIEKISIHVRKAWGLGLGPISNVLLLLEKNGFVVSRVELEDAKTDACSRWRGDRPFIFLGSDKGCAVRSRFDAAHELAHMLLHSKTNLDQIADKEIQLRLEKEANQFASAFLLPRDSFGQEVMSTSLDHFISLKKRWEVSIQAMIYRCGSLKILSESQRLYIRKQISQSGMRKVEPLDDELKPEEPTVLQQAITVLIDKGIISVADILDVFELPAVEIEALCFLEPGTLTRSGKMADLVALRDVQMG